MKQQKGAIMYDGWTNNSIHCMGVFAVYMRKVAYVKNGVIFKEQELDCQLLVDSPMANRTSVVCSEEYAYR